MLHLGERSTGSLLILTTIVQRTADKVHQVNRWKKPEAGLSPSGNSRFLLPLAKRNTCKKKQRPGLELAAETKRLIYRADAEPVTCKIICVPLSNFTLRLAELMTEPWALPVAAVFKATPCIPTTPRVAELMAPFAAAPFYACCLIY